MCGIVGYLGPNLSAPILLEGLKRLEYRGYDSAGIAVLEGATTHIIRSVGKLAKLEAMIVADPPKGSFGIGHTRWATHGRPSVENAHPHRAGAITLVHNGIIENHIAIRKRLLAEGIKIQSDTDTELVAHLINLEFQKTPGITLLLAVRQALMPLKGAYALAVMSDQEPGKIVVAKEGSPLVLGVLDDGMMCGSDVPALLPFTRKMVFLEDGDMALLEQNTYTLFSLKQNNAPERKVQQIDWSLAMAEKQGFKHFMLKEIHEQPRAIEDTLRGRLDYTTLGISAPELEGIDLSKVERVCLLSCGTSNHAAMVGRYYFESLAKIPTTAELASEFRGRDPVVGSSDLVIAVSQSGETIDTLMAAREAKEKGAQVLAIANVIGSAIPRMADAAFYTHAGPEIGVASTKCFITQLANLLMLAVWMGKKKGTSNDVQTLEILEQLSSLPHLLRDTLERIETPVLALAKELKDSRDVLFLGRGLSYPIALEGALKLKEISYIHAEGYAAGEMKHGPIALIDAAVPVIAVAPKDRWLERSIGNIQEAKAREGKTVVIGTQMADTEVYDGADRLVLLPECAENLTPFLTVLPLQLFSYHVADLKGTDVDQPRNLAKTVTVE